MKKIEKGTKFQIVKKPDHILTILDDHYKGGYLILDIEGNITYMNSYMIEKNLNSGSMKYFESSKADKKTIDINGEYYIGDSLHEFMYSVSIIFGDLFIFKKHNGKDAIGYFSNDFIKLMEDGIIQTKEDYEERLNFLVYIMNGNIMKDVKKEKNVDKQKVIDIKIDKIMDSYLKSKNKLQRQLEKSKITAEQYEEDMNEIKNKFNKRMMYYA